MLMTLLQIVFVMVCLVLGISILLQSGKGGGMGAGLSGGGGGGGSASTAVFGGRGAGGFLSRVTIGSAAIFMSMSLLLAYLSSKPQSVLDLETTAGAATSTEDDVLEEGTLDVPLKALQGSGPAGGLSAPSDPTKPGAVEIIPAADAKLEPDPTAQDDPNELPPADDIAPAADDAQPTAQPIPAEAPAADPAP